MSIFGNTHEGGFCMRRVAGIGTRRLVAALLMASVLAGAGGARGAHPREDWYEDMKGHWAEHYVRILWEEGVTDGYLLQRGEDNWYYRYYPDSSMLRDSWATLLARVFSIPGNSRGTYYFDISPPHFLDGGQQVYALLQGAGDAGFLSGPFLRPKETLVREDAMSSLVKSLGLAGYSLSLPPAEVAAILGRFKDGDLVHPDLKPFAAAAVKLGIVEGYPDGTLKPRRPLTRGEASALAARSALIRAWADPNPFSPDGDGYEDETSFYLKGLRNRNLTGWQLTITDAAGIPVKQFTPPPGNPALPPVLPWDGTGADGPLPDGEYFYQAFLTDTKGQVHSSALMPLTILRRGLAASLEPGEGPPGTQFTVKAVTRGDARQVTFTFPGRRPLPLLPAGSAGTGYRWEGQGTIPRGTPPGLHPVLVEASFPGVSRRESPEIRVILPPGFMAIEGWVEPNPVAAGEVLTIGAETAGEVDAVSAIMEDRGAVPLDPTAPGKWEGSYTVPEDAEEREYGLILRGTGPPGTVETELSYRVERTEPVEVTPVLTD